jgi:hypothetical protein
MRHLILRSFAIVPVAVALWAMSSWAVGVEVGRLEGTVTEKESGAPVPGATISVTGKALIGPPRQTTTDDNGHYEIPNLAQGVYTVEIGFTGVVPLRRRIDILPSAATPLNVAWSVELTKEETTVVEEVRHMTKPDSPMAANVFAVEKYEYVPTPRSYQQAIGQAAGTIGTGNANVRGATTRSNRFLIDGLDITDPVSNTFRGNWQFESFQSIEVLTAGLEAKYNAVGAVTNIITRSGSDELHINSYFYNRPNQLTSFDVSGRQTYDGPRPFSDSPKPPLNDYEVGLVVDGPIIKHKLWYSASFRYSNTSSVQPAGPPLNMQAPNRVSKMYQPRLKLTWAPSSKHKFSASVFGDPTTFDFVDFNGAQANLVEPLAAFTQNQGGWHIMGEWDFYISQLLDTKMLLGYQRSGITSGPQGEVRSLDAKYGIYDFDRPRHYNQRDQTTWSNCCAPPPTPNSSTSQFSVDGRPKFQFDFSLTWRPRLLGLHEAEVGFNGLFSHYTVRRVPTGRGVSYIDGPNTIPTLKAGLCDEDDYVFNERRSLDPNYIRNGIGCLTRTTITEVANATFNYNFGFYVQDRWKPTRWLTILPGLRWDRYEDRLKRGDPNVPLPYGDRILLWGFGPRFAVITDLTGDQKTILQASYSRVTQPVYAAVLDDVYTTNTRSTITETYLRNLAPGDRCTDPTRTAPCFGNPQTGSGPGTAYLDTRHHTPTHADELFFRLSREVFRNSVLEFQYTYKKVSNIYARVEQNRIWDPSGNRVIGFVDPTIRSPIFLGTYPSDSYSKYSGFSLIFESRPDQHLDFEGSYTLSYTYGPVADDNPFPTNQYNNPRQAQFFYGYALDTDIRHSIKTATTYLNHGLILGLLVNYRSGQALRKNFTGVNNAPNDPQRLRAPTGLEPGSPINDVQSWTEFRIPDLLTVGVTLAYNFYELIHQQIIISASVTNVFNNTTPNNLNRVDGESFGTVTARENARRVTLGLQYKY